LRTNLTEHLNSEVGLGTSDIKAVDTPLILTLPIGSEPAAVCVTRASGPGLNVATSWRGMQYIAYGNLLVSNSQDHSSLCEALRMAIGYIDNLQGRGCMCLLLPTRRKADSL
jgi:hypothetical protein